MNNVKNILLLFVLCVQLSKCTNSVKPSDKTASAAAGDVVNSSPGDNSTEAETSQTDEREVTNTGERGHPGTGRRNVVTNACTPNPDSSTLGMTVIAQEETLWCWAACGEMVMEKVRGRNIDQCDEANRRFGMNDCCPPRGRPRPSACNQTSWPEFDKYDLRADMTICRALSWEEIKKQIDCKKKAICWTLRWTDDDGECGDIHNGTDTAGHMMVIFGYKIKENGDSVLKVLDPSPVSVGSTFQIKYSQYVCGPGYGHWNDFYNLRRR